VDVNSLRKLLGTPRDGAMLRLALARLLAGRGECEEAMRHLQEAVSMEPGYTAAWKELGRLRLQAGQPEGAREAWTSGLDQAVRNGDKQAEREITVFLRRLEKSTPSG
jgi:Flp pilus assembly protein TadD